MKIYIVNIIPQSLKNKIKNMMESFEYNEKITYELHSQDFGLHILEDDKIYLKESTYNHDYELIKGYSLPDGGNSMDLLIDKYETNNIPVISQLPLNYIITKFHRFEFFKKHFSKFSNFGGDIEKFLTQVKINHSTRVFSLNYQEKKVI